MKIKNNVINLLWTGGWDSTFQLIQSLLIYKSTVRPFYIIDPNRKSMMQELASISKIKEILHKVNPETKKLLLPMEFKMVGDIIIDPNIELAFYEFKQEKHMGIQYLWLSSFCKNQNIFDMQLSIEKSNIPDPNLWDANLEGKLIEDSNNNQTVYKLDSKNPKSKEYTIFKYFSFPLIHTTKSDMFQIANQKGWLSIMDQTWFCLFPTKNNKPCGICKPCIQTLSEGFTHRIPKTRRQYSVYVKHIKQPSKNTIKKIMVSMGFLQKDVNFSAVKTQPITPDPRSSSS